MELAPNRRSADCSWDERRSVVRTAVAIAAAGALGALARYGVEGAVSRRATAFPYRLLEARSYALAGANMLGSAGVGLLALYGGVVLGRAL
jgi:fluoride ion exporter CrcB/FEX